MSTVIRFFFNVFFIVLPTYKKNKVILFNFRLAIYFIAIDSYHEYTLYSILYTHTHIGNKKHKYSIILKFI